MDLLRVSVSKYTRIARATLEAAAEVMAHRWPEWQGALPTRGRLNTIRVALAYKLRQWQKFESTNGDICQAIATPLKGKDLDIRVHVKRIAADHVEYSDLVLSYTGSAEQPVTCTVAPAAAQYPALVADLADVDALYAFGAAHWFDNDLRLLCQALLATSAMPLWPGVTLLLDTAARAAVADLEQLLAGVAEGGVTCRMLSLDNTPANREALARELGEHMQEEAEAILEAAQYTAPNIKRCHKLCEALQAKIQQAESVLECEIPDIWDTVAQIEVTLVMAEEQDAEEA